MALAGASGELFGPSYWAARFVFQRGLALVYFLAFLAAFNQFTPLLGERGLLPVPEFLRFVNFRRAPSIFHFHYSDKFVKAISAAGMILALAALSSISDWGPLWVSCAVWALMYALYLSIMNVGQTFYGFGWESMLLEAGFLVIFLGSETTAVPITIIFLLRWMLFRVEFGAGLIKLRGDQCWRDLTCLNFHHETQPMPNPLSAYFHQLPGLFHKMEVVGNFAAQLVLPFGLFFPQPVAGICGALMFLTQLWLFISGNYSWLNLLTMFLIIPAYSNAQLHFVLGLPENLTAPGNLACPVGYRAVVLVVTIAVIILSYWPARNLLSRRQFMNFSFNPYHLVNTYGAFGTVTRTRYELIVQATDEPVVIPETQWREYEFLAKPGDPKRRPPQVAPYHLRLDWLMWFAAMHPVFDPYAHPWLARLVEKLLLHDPAVLTLIHRAPFDRAPQFIRVLRYHYRFATPAERRETHQWWIRSLDGEFLPPIRLRASSSGAAQP